MPKSASEAAGLRRMHVGGKRGAVGVRFYALDGTICVLIEAESEADARYLCRNVRLEFIGLCDK
jgi:hypothetical protein